MIYVANITTPKETAKNSLQLTRIKVTKGLVYKVEFYFPSGSAGLMGAAVFDGLFQVWPSSVGEFFIGEEMNISFDDLYLKESAPFEFQCYTYNIDDTHAHSVGVRIGLVSSDVFLARFLPTKGYEYLAELVEKLKTEQAARIVVQEDVVGVSPEEWLKQNVAEE
ncbi:MAG: hypothetical protein WAV28_18770 [Sedimentisphaerales bacterium]